MWTALITGLAALAGAAIGGLVTVWATHKTNVAAAERERAQRQYDWQVQKHAEAAAVLIEYMSHTTNVHGNLNLEQPLDNAEIDKLTKLHTQISLTVPGMERVAVPLLDRKRSGEDGLLSAYADKARKELKDLEPKA